jgi:hypothetical protein
MTREQHEVEHINLTLEVINNRIARLERDKARLERRRDELLMQHPDLGKGWDVT